MRRIALLALLAVVGGVAPAGGAPRSDLLATARSYRAGVERMLPLYEKDLRTATEQLDQQVDRYARRLASRAEVEDAARRAATARAELEQARTDIARAAALIADIEMHQQLAALAPPPRGTVLTTKALIRFDGTRRWTLGDLSQVRAFFVRRFGHALPISALGQTPLHDRLGYDHHDAVDVALHPDSPEGRALLDYLREAGIPFLAYRGPVAGAATGAHVHIGLASIRF
jgi:hypothetical protein